jgi:TetR/AcrR family transcriptional regulator, transcriptional repressor of bet genes
MPGAKVPEHERREQILHAAATVSAEVGLSGLTVRRVAEAAGISVGLVFFHYQTMDLLRDALLEWLLERVLRLELAEVRTRWHNPRERLLGLLEEELRAAQELRPEIVLLLEYWVESAQRAAIRQRLQRALEAYRAVFRTLAEEALAGHEHAALSPASLADTAVRGVLGLGLETLVKAEALDVSLQVSAFAALLDRSAR